MSGDILKTEKELLSEIQIAFREAGFQELWITQSEIVETVKDTIAKMQELTDVIKQELP